jgi:hypothetical protein
MVHWPSRTASRIQTQAPPAHLEAAGTNKANSPAGVRAERWREAIAPNKPNLPADRPEVARAWDVRRVECAKQTQFQHVARASCP